MNDLSPAGIGHNQPPDPIDLATEPFGGLLSEVENWTDGEPVTNEAAMKAVDALIRDMKSAKTALKAARDASTAPLHEAWKNEVARWKPTEDDFQRRIDCLVAIVADYKVKLTAEKEATRIAAVKAAREAEESARQAVALARAGDLEAQAEAARAREAFEAQQRVAQRVAKDTVKGMRTVHHHEIIGMSDLLKWMNKDHDGRAALEDCAAEFARKNARDRVMHGVRVWTEKGAF